MSGKEHDDGLDASFIISQAKSRNRPLHPYTPEKEEEASALSEPFPRARAPPPPPATKEEGRRRRGKGQDYERLFIRNAPSNTRSGKTVYIRKEFHERITRIVQVIGKNELSLYSYLDNVLEQHFATYQEEISELYKKRNSDIF
jgi:conjugative transfer protein traB